MKTIIFFPKNAHEASGAIFHQSPKMKADLPDIDFKKSM